MENTTTSRDRPLEPDQRVELCKQVARELAGQTVHWYDVDTGKESRAKVRVVGWGHFHDKCWVVEEVNPLWANIFAVNPPREVCNFTAEPTKRHVLQYRSPLCFDLPPPLPPTDLARFPHVCPRCNSPAYLGFNTVDCSRAACSARKVA